MDCTENRERSKSVRQELKQREQTGSPKTTRCGRRELFQLSLWARAYEDSPFYLPPFLLTNSCPTSSSLQLHQAAGFGGRPNRHLTWNKITEEYKHPTTSI